MSHIYKRILMTVALAVGLSGNVFAEETAKSSPAAQEVKTKPLSNVFTAMQKQRSVKQKTSPVSSVQIYRNAGCGFSLIVPKQWFVMEKETVQKLISELDSAKKENLPELEKKRLDFFLEMLKLGVDIIYCNFDKDFADNITIQTVPIPGKELLEQSDDELRMEIRKLCKGELEYKTEIYEMKRITINGMPCVFIDLSHEPEKTRINNYFFALPDKCFAVALTAKKSTFTEYREQFSEIIQTIKFDTKQ